jgi:hypothetical protein
MPLCRSEDDMQYIYSISNEAGVRIFQLLDGKHSIKQIQEVLKKEFQGKTEEIEGEILTFVDDLLSVQLIKKTKKALAFQVDVAAGGAKGRLTKKPYKTPEVARIKMQPEQAVLSCCLITSPAKTTSGLNYCFWGCPPYTACETTATSSWPAWHDGSS